MLFPPRLLFHLILPANLNSIGALPARFRRPRLLIVGCGDVGMRVLGLLRGKAMAPESGVALAASPRVRVLALTSSPERVTALRSAGAAPLVGDLDDYASLRRLAGIATHVLHLAPPARSGKADERTLALARVLRLRSLPRALTYVSTSGVYGDCGGALVPETRVVAPATERAQRRVHAENALRVQLGATGVRVNILRVPGIYAPDRVGGTPEARLLRGTPVLVREDDVFTNHIHADDLARACRLALWRGAPQRAYNISDQSALRMGDYFDLAADLYRLPRPPRIARAQAELQLGEMQMSFMRESRRLDAGRMEVELGLRLNHPKVLDGLKNAVV